MLTASQYKPNFKNRGNAKKQRYLFQLNKLLNVARRIGKPSIIYALQKLIVKHAGAK